MKKIKDIVVATILIPEITFGIIFKKWGFSHLVDFM